MACMRNLKYFLVYLMKSTVLDSQQEDKKLNELLDQ